MSINYKLLESSPESATELLAKIKELAKLSEEDLRRTRATDLRKYAKGVVPKATRRAEDLIRDILLMSQDARVVEEVLPDVKPADVLAQRKVLLNVGANKSQEIADYSGLLYKALKDLIAKHKEKDGVNYNPKIWGEIGSLATRINNWLNNHEGDTDGKLHYTTKLSYKTKICNTLEVLIEDEGDLLKKDVQIAFDYLKSQLSVQLTDLNEKKQEDGRQGLAARKEGKLEISFLLINEFMQAVFENLENYQPCDWKKVSIALIMATGRRPSEIHQESTQFELVDTRHVMFTGQLKAKGDAAKYFSENPAYEIPTLYDAEKVVTAHLWLKDNKKVVDSPEKADRRYSKDLSEFVKNIRRHWDLEHPMLTPKGFRAIYAQTANHIFNNSDPDSVLYLARILGHSRGDLAQGRKIADMLTPQSYSSDFVVTDWECAKEVGKVD